MKIVRKIYHLIVGTKIPTLSGSLCFFLILNGGSYLFLFVSLFSYLPLDVFEILNPYLNDGGIKDILVYLLNHHSSLSSSIFLLISSIYSSSSLYYHFLEACELITKQPFKATFGKRIQALILVPIMLVILLALLLVIYFLIQVLGYYIYILLFVFMYLIILLLNKIALRIYPLKRLLKGTTFSFIYILIFSISFIFYLNIFSNFKIVYGYLSFFIILLFYLYVNIIGIFLGIYINCKNLEVLDLLSIKKYYWRN